MRHVVILGAGTAGTMVANKLRAASSPADLQITIVDQDDHHHYQPGYLFLPFGQLAPGQIVRARHSFIPDGVDLVLCGVDKVDADAGFSGKRLSFASGAPPELDIAHELIHARQAQLPGGRMNKKLSQPGDPSEKEAEMLAPRLAKGEAVQVRQPLTGKLSRKYKFAKNDKYNRKNIKGNSGNSGNRPSAVADAGKASAVRIGDATPMFTISEEKVAEIERVMSQKMLSINN